MYSIVRITAENAEACYAELVAQIHDGIFENSRVGKYVEIIERDADYTYNFENQKDLEDFIEKRKNDKTEHYYYGFIENFEGLLYSIEDIKKDAEEYPCCEDNPCIIYEWILEG